MPLLRRKSRSSPRRRSPSGCAGYPAGARGACGAGSAWRTHCSRSAYASAERLDLWGSFVLAFRKTWEPLAIIP